MPYLLRINAMRIISAISVLAVSVHADERMPERIEFNRDIRPILSDACFPCHGPDPAQRKANLRFDTKSGAFSELSDGRHPIVAGQPEESELIRRITTSDTDTIMPPPEFERRLSTRQVSLLKRWIEQGADWENHWSFVKPVRTTPPTVKSPGWLASPIDAFVLAKLEREEIP